MDVVDEGKLCEYNEKIVQYLLQLRQQRHEGTQLIDKQIKEKAKLETEMQKMAYRLTLLDKSIAQRSIAIENYDVKIKEAEEKYRSIIEKSESLLVMVKTNLEELENIMDKRVGTGMEEDVYHEVFNTDVKCDTTCKAWPGV